MKSIISRMRNVLLMIVVMKLSMTAPGWAQHWPHWRGPTHDGVSTERGLPDTWSAQCVVTPAHDDAASGPLAIDTGELQRGRPRDPNANFEGRPIVPTVCANIQTRNVAWKLPLPAYSGSTPIIWGDIVFLNVATGSNTGHLELWAIDRNKQDVIWKRQLVATNHMERKQNMSSPSPVADGKYGWVMTGYGVLSAFDFSGTAIWSRDLQKEYGRFGFNWGYASSPLLKGPNGKLKPGTGDIAAAVGKLRKVMDEASDKYRTADGKLKL